MKVLNGSLPSPTLQAPGQPAITRCVNDDDRPAVVFGPPPTSQPYCAVCGARRWNAYWGLVR